MVIDVYDGGYKDDNGTWITLEDTETGSRFYFVISDIEDGVTYTLSNFNKSKYCYIGNRYWNYRDATFKRTTDDTGLIHVVATVLTEHGDSLTLKYNPVAATGVALNKSSTTIKYGGNETLIATVSPDDADNKSVTWSSSDESVATVDEAGKVTAVSVGSAVITVTTEDGEFNAVCAVTVTESAISVTNRINALPDAKDVTLNDEAAIKKARAAYDSLDADEKALVSQETLKKLTDDEAAYQNLVDTAAANKVIELIDALPNASDVTVNDKEAIEAARAAYESLTDAQKAKVPADKLQKLVDDENALKSISSGLPTGAIVGIIIGSVAVAGLGGFALVWFVIKKKTWADFVAIFKKK
ncbi:MAG: Ig-like domain-containing protein [Bacilli bacterium]|nr:Ig-like domain-containing protein [Bacilli bacterium]